MRHWDDEQIGYEFRLGKFCGNGPDLWLRMQQAYDLTPSALRKVVAKILTAKARAA